VRATRSRDVRAPNLRDRFDQTLGGAGGTDRYNPAFNGQTFPFSGISTSGGNPGLRPEKADTTTAGIVLQPSFLDGFQASLDWYKVNIKGAIASLNTQTIVDQCNLGDTSLCQYVHRGTTSINGNPLGDINNIDAFFLNLARETYAGFDLELGYRKALTLFGGGPESISVRVFGTHYTTVEQQPPSLLDPATGNRVAGRVIDNLPTTPDSATAVISYRNGPMSLTIAERYQGSAKININFVESTVRTVAGFTTVDDNTLGATFTTDLTASWQPESIEGLRVYSTITNLFDRAPQIQPATSAGRTVFPPGVVGDLIGRRYVVGAEYKF